MGNRKQSVQVADIEMAAKGFKANRKADGKADDKRNAEEYKFYPARWFMLFVVCFQNVSNALMWITFAAAADSTIIFYGISSLQLNMLSMVFMIATIPCGFVASWVLDTFGLRTSLIVSAWMTGVGGLLRNVSTMSFIPRQHAYPVLLTGQTLTACAQPFVMFAPTKLAALWFPENRRATANMIGSMMNPLGNMLTFIIVPLIVDKPDDIPTALWVISAPAFLITIVTTLGVRRSRPPTPPSASADSKSEPFLTGLKQIICNKNYIVLNLAFGTGLALFSSLASLLQQIVCPRGYSDDFAGLCGALMIVLGVILSGAAGVYVDKTKQFDEVLKVSYCLAALAGIAFTQVSRLRDQHVLVAVTSALIGGFGLVIYPISMELAVEVTYPVAEATSSGLCIVMGQLQGIGFMFAMQYLARPLPPSEVAMGTACKESVVNGTAKFEPQDWTYGNLYVFNVISTVAIVALVVLFKPDYKRLEVELQAAAASKQVGSVSLKVRPSSKKSGSTGQAPEGQKEEPNVQNGHTNTQHDATVVSAERGESVKGTSECAKNNSKSEERVHERTISNEDNTRTHASGTQRRRNSSDSSDNRIISISKNVKL